jgi:hypothetical protein
MVGASVTSRAITRIFRISASTRAVAVYRLLDCALFCADPRSKTIALGSNGTGNEITCISAENQHHSKSSYWVGKANAATVNRRVASSNLARGANPYDFANRVETPQARKSPGRAFGDGQSRSSARTAELRFARPQLRQKRQFESPEESVAEFRRYSPGQLLHLSFVGDHRIVVAAVVCLPLVRQSLLRGARSRAFPVQAL